MPNVHFASAAEAWVLAAIMKNPGDLIQAPKLVQFAGFQPYPVDVIDKLVDGSWVPSNQS